MAEYVTSVGMEVHAELLTESKMFCRCPVAFGGEPNTRVCPVCLGLPGALPVPNRLAIEMVVKTALALNCTIAMDSVFHRKNYFYPDLPKGYQTSQYGETNPFGYRGWLEIPASGGGTKRVHIRRVHLEEDTGKLTHVAGEGSGIDYNRAGVPLMEIVTDFPPDIETPDEARSYLVQLRSILVWLGVCDGKMEQGSMRCEPNISVRPAGSESYGTKSELKNLNSFRSVQLGVEFEAKRQAALLDQGQAVMQETRGWNENTLTSYSMRSKETEADYRYFPCPDLAPVQFDQATIDRLRLEIPELPHVKLERYQSQLGLTQKDAETLLVEKAWAQFFEDAVKAGGEPKAVFNLMTSDFAKLLNESDLSVEQCKVTPKHLAGLAALVSGDKITSKAAKEVMRDMFETGEKPDVIVETKGLAQVSDSSAIISVVQDVLQRHPDVVAQYRAGKQNVLGFLVGQVMRETQGRSNPSLVQEEMRKQLEGA